MRQWLIPGHNCRRLCFRRLSSFTQADTVKLPDMSSTGPSVSAWPPPQSNYSTAPLRPSVHVVPGRSVRSASPTASAETSPEPSSSVHDDSPAMLGVPRPDSGGAESLPSAARMISSFTSRTWPKSIFLTCRS